MAEFTDLLKVIIEKVGFKTFLFSVAVTIVTNKLWLNDWQWSIVVFCGCYILVSFIVWLCKLIKCKCELTEYERKKSKELVESQNAEYKRMCIIYDSFPQMTQQRLIELYKLPQQTYSNVRILNDMPNQHSILQACSNVCLKYQVIGVKESLGSYIITIKSEFCDVLAKHYSDFE